jgi:hypothetical protein
LTGWPFFVTPQKVNSCRFFVLFRHPERSRGISNAPSCLDSSTPLGMTIL